MPPSQPKIHTHTEYGVCVSPVNETHTDTAVVIKKRARFRLLVYSGAKIQKGDDDLVGTNGFLNFARATEKIILLSMTSLHL